MIDLNNNSIPDKHHELQIIIKYLQIQPLRRIRNILTEYKTNAVQTKKVQDVEDDCESRMRKVEEEFPKKFRKEDKFDHRDMLEKLMMEEKEDQLEVARYNAQSTINKTISDCKKKLMNFQECKKQLMEFLKNINKENSIEGKDLAAALGAAMEKSAPNPEILQNLDDKDAKEVQEKTAKLIVSNE